MGRIAPHMDDASLEQMQKKRLLKPFAQAHPYGSPVPLAARKRVRELLNPAQKGGKIMVLDSKSRRTLASSRKERAGIAAGRAVSAVRELTRFFHIREAKSASQRTLSDFAAVAALPILVKGSSVASGIASKTSKRASKWEFSPASLPSLAIFVGSCLLFISAFFVLSGIESKRQASKLVLGTATGAYEDLAKAGESLLSADMSGAQTSLDSAYNGFDQALSQLSDLGAASNLLPQGIEAGKLLSAAHDATLALQYLTSGMQNILAARVSSQGVSLPPSGGGDLASGLASFSPALSYAQNVRKTLATLDPDAIAEPYRTKILDARQMLESLSPVLERLATAQEIFVSLAEGDKKQLLLFQNPRELRATGGFIGTYGLVSFTGGRLSDFMIQSVYEPDGQLKEKIAPPSPLSRTLTKAWGMRDSNWFFDFASSARKAREFYRKETGVEVDGVIAFTPAPFERLLALTGPIPMPEYRTTLTAENFMAEVQYQTSVVYDRKLNQPKKFLADFAPRLLDRLQHLDQQGWTKTLDILLSSLNGRDIQMYSSDPAQQLRYEQAGWSGEVRETSGDYLALVSSSVGGGKTNADLKDEAKLSISANPDGTWRHALTIVRTHTAGSEKDLPVNADFLRIFTPEGSRLVSAEGFDRQAFFPSAQPDAATDADLALLDAGSIYHPASGTVEMREAGKTVFGNWILSAPGAARTVTVVYDSPPLLARASTGEALVSLLVQKQAGRHSTNISASYALPQGASVVWTYPQVTEDEIFTADLSADRVFGIIYKK